MIRNLLRTSRLKWAALFLIAGLLVPAGAWAQAVPVKVVRNNNGFELLRDNKPYFVKGGGGGGPKAMIAECGGNSFRTWGVGNGTMGELNEAHKLGLTVTVGIWFPHGANWSDQNFVRKQIDGVRQMVQNYRNHPAVLCWALGNEMETEGRDKPDLWQAINEMARVCHDLDPNHPVMTVMAEIPGKRLQMIHDFCPDLDIVGINSYGSGASVGARYQKGNPGKPFIITEYGPAGTWETPKNSFGAAIEPTSTEKTKAYLATYQKSVLGQPGLCLGSYVFTWGFKREATATWFGLFLPDGARLGTVDLMYELWSGKPPKFQCPQISKIALGTPDQLAPGDTLRASVQVSDPQNAKMEIQWVFVREMASYGITGPGEKGTADFSNGIVKNGGTNVEVKMPAGAGIYRLYCYVYNPYNAAACASVAINVGGAGKTRGK